MRLTKDQLDGIVAGLDVFLKNHPAELRLYGSRVHDHLKGGDIDLLLLTEREDFADNLRSKKIDMVTSIQKHIGEQKIDLTIAVESELAQDSFLQMVFPESQILFQWS